MNKAQNLINDSSLFFAKELAIILNKAVFKITTSGIVWWCRCAAESARGAGLLVEHCRRQSLPPRTHDTCRVRSHPAGARRTATRLPTHTADAEPGQPARDPPAAEGTVVRCELAGRLIGVDGADQHDDWEAVQWRRLAAVQG